METCRIIFTETNNAFFNMALDEALVVSCQEGSSPPLLRLYLWEPPAVSIGYFQCVEKAVSLKQCRDKGIHVVRRITGGRAVLHEEEITYSVCASSDYFHQLGGNTNETYRRISMALLESLCALGVDGEWVKPSRDRKPTPSRSTSCRPCFMSNSRYEILVKGKKLIGSAQRRFSFPSDDKRKDSFIQHGSILTGEGGHSLAELLPKGSSAQVIKRSLHEKSTNLESALGRRVDPEEVISALKKGFEEVFTCQVEDSRVSERELQAARSLMEKKYLTEQWNLKR